jgi:hypothetical protein
MKRRIIFSLILLMWISGQGQDLNNVFSQKSADLKSMAKQIALLQLYIGWLEKGYGIAKNGLTFIAEMKKGEMNLHSLFFSSLVTVNPEIRNSAQVFSIIDCQIQIDKELKKVLSVQNLTVHEMQYLLTVKENLLKDCALSLDNLAKVISDHIYQMTDDERIVRIDRIYLNMERNRELATEFANEAKWVAEQRIWEARDIQSLKNLE